MVVPRHHGRLSRLQGHWRLRSRCQMEGLVKHPAEAAWRDPIGSSQRGGRSFCVCLVGEVWRFGRSVGVFK